MPRKKRIIVCFLSLITTLGFTQDINCMDADFDAYVEKTMQDWSVPGMSLGIIKDNQLIVAKGYGVKSINNPDPVDEQTVFPIASVTKSFTSTLLAILARDKKLEWDDPIVKHLPEFMLDDPYLTREITIRDLLSHRTGFERVENLWYLTSYSQQDIFKRLKYLKSQSNLRTKFSYNNMFYSVLGLLAESIEGDSWDNLIQKYIFSRLDMTASSANMKELPLLSNVANSHKIYDGNLETREWLDFQNCYPAIGICSNVADLLKWVSFQMEYDTDFLIEAHSAQFVLNDPNWLDYFPQSTFCTYGFAWVIHDYYGRKILCHSGCMEGANSLIVTIPEENLGIVILSNKDTWAFFSQAIVYRIYDLLFNTSSRSWSEEFLAKYQKSLRDRQDKEDEWINSPFKGTIPSLTLKNYCGIYEDSLYGSIIVNLTDKNTLSISSNTFNGQLEHCYLDAFKLISDEDSIEKFLVVFSIDGQGDSTEMKIETPEGVVFRKITN